MSYSDDLAARLRSNRIARANERVGLAANDLFLGSQP